MDIPQPRYTLLDGATATNLFCDGVPPDVCIEEFILANPAILTTLQADFVASGSDVIYAPTFSANRHALSQHGLQSDVARINCELVALTKSVAKSALVAGSLSAIGLFIEPYGTSSFDEIFCIYTEQATALNDAGVDLFVIETISTLSQARAAVLACRPFNKPIYVTITINEKGKTSSGASPLSFLISLQGLKIAAFGINCSFGPSSMVDVIKDLSEFNQIPLIAKPSVTITDPVSQNPHDLSPLEMRNEMSALLDAGATIIGGCCGTTPAHIAQMRDLMDSYIRFKTIKQDTHDIILATPQQTFAFDATRIDFTEPILCEYDMADSFIQAEEDSRDVLLLHINTVDDAYQLAKNYHLARLPICLYSTNEQALDAALRLYNGKAMVDANCPLESEVLQELAAKYGATLY